MWMDRGGCGGMHARICACTFTHSSVYACICALCVYACACTTWWHLNQLLAGSKASRALLCPASVSSGFKGDTTGTVPYTGSTGRAFICQICPPWASTLSPPAPSTETPFIRVLPLSTQTFKTHREGFTQNELCPLIAVFFFFAVCAVLAQTDANKSKNFALNAICMT